MVAKFLPWFLQGCSLSKLHLCDKNHGTTPGEQTSGGYQEPGKLGDGPLSVLLRTHGHFTPLCVSESLFLQPESLSPSDSPAVSVCHSRCSGLARAGACTPLPLPVAVVFPLTKVCRTDSEGSAAKSSAKRFELFQLRNACREKELFEAR